MQISDLALSHLDPHLWAILAFASTGAQIQEPSQNQPEIGFRLHFGIEHTKLYRLNQFSGSLGKISKNPQFPNNSKTDVFLTFSGPVLPWGRPSRGYFLEPLWHLFCPGGDPPEVFFGHPSGPVSCEFGPPLGRMSHTF